MWFSLYACGDDFSSDRYSKSYGHCRVFGRLFSHIMFKLCLVLVNIVKTTEKCFLYVISDSWKMWENNGQCQAIWLDGQTVTWLGSNIRLLFSLTLQIWQCQSLHYSSAYWTLPVYGIFEDISFISGHSWVYECTVLLTQDDFGQLKSSQTWSSSLYVVCITRNHTI